ncbi:MAG: agmatinase, partial [Ktedonobacterales bacterium]
MADYTALAEALAPAIAFMHLDAQYTDYSSARVVITPVPFDGTTCYRPGTREGPQAIIAASRNLELYDAELRRSPYTVGIHTLRPVEIINGDAEAMVNRTEQVTGHLLDADKFVVTLGGDHLTSIGVIRAFARRHAGMSVLQLDAHADLRDDYEGARYSAATIMRRTLEVCPRTAQVGIRSLSDAEARLVEERKLPIWLASEIHAQTLRGRREWIEDVVSALGDEVYLTFDIDAFDP